MMGVDGIERERRRGGGGGLTPVEDGVNFSAPAERRRTNGGIRRERGEREEG